MRSRVLSSVFTRGGKVTSWAGRPARPPRVDAPSAREPAEEGGDNPPDSNWPRDRLDIAEMIWGEGFYRPGGADYVQSLVATLGLSPECSVLEFGAGGGGACAIVHQYGADVTAWETDPEIVARGSVLAKVHDLEAKAGINQLDLSKLQLRARFYQGALVRDMLHTVEDKPALLGAIAGAVKPGMEVVLTDVVAEDPAAARVWASLEPHPVYLWSPKDAQKALGAAQIQIRRAEDHGERYVAMVLRAFHGFVGRLEKERPPPAVLGPTIEYVERWGRRISEIQAGRLAYYRRHRLAR